MKWFKNLFRKRFELSVYPTCEFIVSSSYDSCSPTQRHYVVHCKTHDVFVDSDCFIPSLSMGYHLEDNYPSALKKRS